MFIKYVRLQLGRSKLDFGYNFFRIIFSEYLVTTLR